ncbi:MAG: LLM class F420-dependent oxidoreductase [Acidimicrobiales bacterium]
MRLGLITPVLTRLPGAHAGWEDDAGIAEVAEVVRAADRLGFDHVTCSEHVAIPTDVAKVRGATYWDPLATFGYLAACTQRIRLATYVLVLGYHHPLAIAKRYGTLDVVSGGRLVLGVGVGSLKEEFDLLGADFAERGPRADDALRALRASLSQTRPEYDGSHVAYRDVIVDPCAQQERVPLWIGGRTFRSLRRAVELADGWAPFGLSREEAAAMLARVELPDAFEVVLSPMRRLDPVAEPDGVREELAGWVDAGATVVNPRVAHHSLAHYVEQLEALVA